MGGEAHLVAVGLGVVVLVGVNDTDGSGTYNIDPELILGRSRQLASIKTSMDVW
jgi:hypothetical protein